MNSEQDLDYDYEAYKDYEDDIYKDYEDYEDYKDYIFYNKLLSPILETNISSPSSTLEINTSTLETNATLTLISETDFILSRKPSPLWLYFKMQATLRMLAVNHNDIQNLIPTTETWSKIERGSRTTKAISEIKEVFDQYTTSDNASSNIVKDAA
ncbi:23959_t:CDS:2, partial [Gigaspora margarita]